MNYFVMNLNYHISFVKTIPDMVSSRLVVSILIILFLSWPSLGENMYARTHPYMHHM